MKLIINGITNDVPNISGVKLDTMKALAPKMEMSQESLEKIARLDKSEFSQIGKQIAGIAQVAAKQKEYVVDGEKVVEITTSGRAELKGEPATLVSDLFDAMVNIQQGQIRYLEEETRKGRGQTFADQCIINAEYADRAFADMRKNTPEIFRAYITQNDVLERIVAGNAKELGDFTIDDWLDTKGEGWRRGIGNVSDETKQKILDRAREKGLLP